MLLGVGKADLGLAYGLAFLAAQAWDLEGDESGFAADGQGAEDALIATGNPDVLRPTLGAAEPVAWLVDAEDGSPFREMFTDGLVANEAEGTYQ